MSRPLLAPCLAYCAGVMGMQQSAGDPRVAAGLLMVCAVGWLWFQSLRRCFLVAAFLPVGCLIWFIESTPGRAEDLRALIDPESELVSIRGRLLETPSIKVLGSPEAPRLRTRVMCRVEGLRRGEEWIRAAGDVLVTVPGVLPDEFFRTRLVEVSGVLHPPPAANAPGLFDARSFFADQCVWRVLDSERVADWRLCDLGPVVAPWSERFLPWARRRLAAGLPDDESARLLAAMALGWKTPLTGDVDDAFMQSGTLHVFAISGLHIALVAGLLVGLLSLIRMPRSVAGLIAIPCVWAYIAATGWQASAIRSGIMTSVIALGWTLTRPSDLLNSLAGAALLILLVDPGQLFQAGFLLSFVAVAGLAVLVPGIQVWLLRILLPASDPMLPESLQPRWRRWMEGPTRALCLSLATGLAAGVATLPLVWQFFHVVSPVGVLANLLVVPLSSLALAAEFGSLTCGSLWPWLGEVFNASAWLWMKLMVECSRIAAGLPGGHYWVAAPPWHWWALWYAAVLAACCGEWNTVRRRWLGLAALIAGLGWVAWQVSRDGQVPRWTVLDPSGALWIEGGPSHQKLLVDTGSPAEASMVVVPFVHARGVGRLGEIVLSRSDRRHSGGLPVVLEAFRPGDLCISGGWKPRLGPEWLGTNWSGRIQSMAAPRTVAGLDLLHPDSGLIEPVASDAAVVFLGTEEGVRLAWLGDLASEGQRRLAARLTREYPAGLEVDVLIAAVPPRGSMLSEALLGVLRPRALVIASEPHPSPRMLPAETWQRLKRRGIPVLRTDRHGTVTVEISAGEVRMRSQRGFVRTLPVRGSIAAPR